MRMQTPTMRNSASGTVTADGCLLSGNMMIFSMPLAWLKIP